MKTVLVSVACCAGNFVKVFLGSFRKYYPKHPIIFVDSSYKDLPPEPNQFLLRRDDIIYVYNNAGARTHGANLDVGLVKAAKLGFELMINVDIDSLFLMPGVVEACVEGYKEGFKFGGARHIKHYNAPEERARLEKQGRGCHIHSSFGYYDVALLRKHSLSFDENVYTGSHNRDTAEQISYTLEELGYEKKILPIKYIYHFVAGTIDRDKHKGKYTHKAMATKQGEARYFSKLNKFFNRKDVKCYL